MKPILTLISAHRSSRCDGGNGISAHLLRAFTCEYQSPEKESSVRGVPPERNNLSERLRSFRRLSDQFQREESPGHFWPELAMFVIIALLSACSLLLMANALSELLNV